MPKRLKYLVSSLVAAIGFYLFVNLPYSSHYYGLLVGIVLVAFCFWFGLGVIFNQSLYIRLMSVILPVGFFVGFGLFATLLPQTFWTVFMSSFFFGVVCYVIFLVENLFVVSIGYRVPPLYRAAYTVGLVILLLTAFFLFDSLFSFKLIYWLNFLIIFVVSVILFMYVFYSVTIELPDDGKDKNFWMYVLVPGLVMAELGMVMSFWPVGIFKGSIYLVAAVYILAGLIQLDLRERLFKRSWVIFSWITVAIVLGMILTTSWR